LPFTFFAKEVCESENAKRFAHPGRPFRNAHFCKTLI